MSKVMLSLSKGVGLLTVMLGVVGYAQANDESIEQFPSDNAEITVAYGAGGGSDILARTIKRLVEDQGEYSENIIVKNREGGSGAKGWGYVSQQQGSDYHLAVISGTFITTPLKSNTGWTYEDFTPVGLLASDALLFVVDSDSPAHSWQEWVDYAKDRESVPVGGVGTVGVDFIVQKMLANESGYDIRYVPFNDEGQLGTALSSGSIEAIVANPGMVIGQIRADELRPLLFSGPSRLKSLPEVPTGEEQGIEGLPALPRGLVMAPDASDEARQWWVDAMKEIVETDAWKEYYDDNYLTGDPIWGESFGDYLNELNAKFTNILEQEGVL